MDGGEGCPVGILIDLSEPVTSGQSNQEDENSVPPTDPIEVTRRDSLSELKVEIEDTFKQDLDPKKFLAPQNSASDVQLIDDEVFDFDLPVSPESMGEGGGRTAPKADDEEVFFGPMGFTEKCIAAGVTEEAIQPLSPLRPDQMAELAKEAYSVACRIAMMNTSENSVSSSSPAKLKKPLSCRRKLTSLVTVDTGGDPHAVSTHDSEVAENAENISPKKRRRSSSPSKDSPPDTNVVGKECERKGTFTKEDQEHVETLVSSRVTQSGEKEKKTVTGDETRPSRQGTRRLQPPSKLRRYNNSQPNLTKSKLIVSEEVDKEHEGCEDSTAETVPPVTRKSLQLPRAAGGGKNQRQGKGDAEATSDGGLPDAHRTRNRAHPPPRPGVRRAHSLNMKSGLPSAWVSKLALPSGKSAVTSSGQNAGLSGGDTAASTARNSSGIPKGPATKLQLLQPGQLQRKAFAVGRGKKASAASSGPLKALSQPRSNMGDTVERPYNPALAAAAAAGNSQCPNTPAAQKSLPPRVLSMSSEASTPAKSSCSSSSVCGSTPGSVSKRVSLLPTSNKHRSTTSSLPPPSPMSVGSSSSSVFKHSSASDAADSPVFDSKMASRLARSRRTSGAKESCTNSDLDGHGTSPLAFKSRKPLVQNTPDLPKRTLSRWSPMRKPKAVPLEDQVSMCTKRVTPQE